MLSRLDFCCTLTELIHTYLFTLFQRKFRKNVKEILPLFLKKLFKNHMY